jgi:hypothetical protein
VAVKQTRPEPIFQSTHGLAHSGLGEAEMIGRSTKTSNFDDAYKHARA